WISNNYSRIASGEQAKLRLIDVLPALSNSASNVFINPMAIALYSEDQSPAVRRAAYDWLIKTLPTAPSGTLLALVGNNDLSVSKAALKCLDQKNWEWPEANNLVNLLGAEQRDEIKAVILGILIKALPSATFETLITITGSSDINLSKAALKMLSDAYAWEKVPDLIALLVDALAGDPAKRNNEKREEIIHTLEIITGQNFGDKPVDWQKWWAENPAIPDAALSFVIGRAIKKGTDYLIKRCAVSPGTVINSSINELMFYALIRSGQTIPPALQKTFIASLLAKNLDNTYNVAILAMAFSELDRVKYAERIAQCAQFLLSNQGANGGWGYGMRMPPDKLVLTDVPQAAPPVSATSTSPSKKLRIAYARNKSLSGFNRLSWDTSISQFAVLGLRACAEANIEIPVEAWRDAEKAFCKNQQHDGGWGCCYGVENSSHSMAAAGLGALAICLFFQDKDIRENKPAQQALNWLNGKFAIHVPLLHGGVSTICYYLYGVERAGNLLGIDTFNTKHWYSFGARFLLSDQLANGSWNDETDTCFAILFLSKATRPLKKIVTVPDK
ncbi:MAG: prenyltransferase/squalene oxidase repeat-containing protein, partial [Planctomycetota bacterium]